MILEGFKVTATARNRAPQAFRSYLVMGDHWRAGRRLRAGPEVFAGLAMHRGPSQAAEWTHEWADHLQQAITEGRIEAELRTARVRFNRVEEALGAVAEDRPDEAAALRYFLLPLGRRPHDARRQASLMEVSERVLYLLRDRAVELLWDELGEVW